VYRWTYGEATLRRAIEELRSTELGRCVVMCGLPYANPTDPELMEKMQYLDSLQPPSAQHSNVAHVGESLSFEHSLGDCVIDDCLVLRDASRAIQMGCRSMTLQTRAVQAFVRTDRIVWISFSRRRSCSALHVRGGWHRSETRVRS
jgi:hypothetical protein